MRQVRRNDAAHTNGVASGLSGMNGGHSEGLCAYVRRYSQRHGDIELIDVCRGDC